MHTLLPLPAAPAALNNCTHYSSTRARSCVVPSHQHAMYSNSTSVSTARRARGVLALMLAFSFSLSFASGTSSPLFIESGSITLKSVASIEVMMPAEPPLKIKAVHRTKAGEAVVLDLENLPVTSGALELTFVEVTSQQKYSLTVDLTGSSVLTVSTGFYPVARDNGGRIKLVRAYLNPTSNPELIAVDETEVKLKFSAR